MLVLITEELLAEKSEDLMLLRIGTISTSLRLRTWDMVIGLYLDSISAKMLQVGSVLV